MMNITITYNLAIYNVLKLHTSQIRKSSKIAAQLSQDVLNKLTENKIKPRQHPGINRINKIAVPKYIQNGIERSVGDYPIKKLVKDGSALSRYLNARHPPSDQSQINQRIMEIESEINEKFPAPLNLNTMSDEQLTQYRNNRQSKIKKILHERIMAWKPMSYGEYEAIVYAVGRSAQEYAICLKILKEISCRDSAFKPTSYFDFGSGVGTGMWAASSLWKDSIYEYFNVDSSREMNDLSDNILREGNENKESHLKNVYYRQFLPATNTKYDIVLSAFTLFELPDATNRQEVLLNLWDKCNSYLVLVEEGTRKGFELITEARNILSSLQDPKQIGHVFAPCPHDLNCPRLMKADDRTPCNFEVNFERLHLADSSTVGSKHLYSYLVLKKDIKSNSDGNWPRIVRPTLIRPRHAICRMCTSKGKLQEIIFTASKHGKLTYRCAKSSNWGDRLPIDIADSNESLSD